MYDLSQPNSKPGKCGKCSGSGQYRWGPQINGQSKYSGQCHSCGGKGFQTRRDIRRDVTYNRFKIARILCH
jgi:DnaJ-class molecular chaperone